MDIKGELRQASIGPRPIENHHSVNEKRIDLKGKILNFLERDNSPQEILKNIASLGDHKEVTSEVDRIDTGTLISDQVEISQIKKDINSLDSSKDNSIANDKERIYFEKHGHFFKDRETPLEKESQIYQKRLETFKGRMERLGDIKKLERQGIYDAAHCYDTLRARGFTRLYVKNNLKEIVESGQNFDLVIKGFDRQHLINLKSYNDSSLNTRHEELSRLRKLGSIPDSEFKQRFDYLNSCSFLKQDHSIQEIGIHRYRDEGIETCLENTLINGIRPDAKRVLDSIKDIVVENELNCTETEQVISQLYLSFENILEKKTFSKADKQTYEIAKEKIVRVFSAIGRQDDIPLILVRNIYSNNLFYDNGLPNESFLEAHKLLKNNNGEYDRRKDLSYWHQIFQNKNSDQINYLFHHPEGLSVNQTTFSLDDKFLRNFYLSEFGQDKSIDLTDEIITSLPEDQQVYWVKLSQNDNPAQRECYLLSGVYLDDRITDKNQLKFLENTARHNSNNSYLKDYFNQDGSVKSDFFRHFYASVFRTTQYLEEKGQPPKIPPEVLNSFSVIERDMWQKVIDLKDDPDKMSNMLYVVSDERQRLSPEFFQNFYVQFFKNNDLPINISQEILDTFDSKYVTFWSGLTSLKDRRYQDFILDKITDNHYSQRDQQNILSNYFYEGNILKVGIIKEFYLSQLEKNPQESIKILPKDLACLSDEEKNVFLNINYIKNAKEQIFYLNYTGNNKDLFIKDGQIQSQFYEAFYATLDNLKDGIKIDPDIFKSFSSEQQQLWQKVINTQDSVCQVYILSILNRRGLLLQEHFNKDNLPTPKFYIDFIHDTRDYYPDNRGITIPENILESFSSDQDRQLWNQIVSLQDISLQDFLVEKLYFTDFSDIDPKLSEGDSREKVYNRYFNSDGFFTSDFFVDFFKKNKDTPIEISSNLFNNLSSGHQLFWKAVIGLDNRKQQQFFLNFSTDQSQEYFSGEKVNSSFFHEYYSNQFKFYNGKTSIEISETNFENFSEHDQRFWEIFKNLPIDGLESFVLSHFETYEKLITPNFLPTTDFFKLAKEAGYNHSLIQLITPEFISTRPEREQLFWNNIIATDTFCKELGPIGIEFDDKDEITDNLIFEFLNQPKPDIFQLNQKLDYGIGRHLSMIGLSKSTLEYFYSDIFNQGKQTLEDILANGGTIELNQSNWETILTTYIGFEQNLSKNLTYTLENIFKDPKNKNICLQGLQTKWLEYLRSGETESLPISLKIISWSADELGFGPLSQINSLANLISSVEKKFSVKSTAPITKTEILSGLLEVEERFSKNKWSNDEKTNFYNVSRDIILSSPSLFTDYLSLFKNLSPSDLKQFNTEIYPLYKTELVLIENRDRYGNSSFDPKKLIDIRKNIRNFSNFETEKENLLSNIKQEFKDRFQIIKIPQSISQQEIRSIKNISTYLGNIHSRSPDKETILGFYLSLMINNRWEDFRNGVKIDPSEFLSTSKSQAVSEILERRDSLISPKVIDIGIGEENIPEFIKLIQDETQSFRIGDIETIDVKLNSIIQNIYGLEDLDLYPELLDKQSMELLLKWGNKKVGGAVAKIYQQNVNPNRELTLSDEEKQIISDIEKIAKDNNLDLKDQVSLKENFQDRLKPLATIVNISSYIKEKGVPEEIEILMEALQPTTEVVDIFNKLGEEFKISSGARALSQDLDYLTELAIKKETLITPEENLILSTYISGIRDQLVKLDDIYNQVKIKFENLKQSNSNSKNELLNKHLGEIEKIINMQSSQQIITSTATGNLNYIIENIRECLSCTNEGCNNDTDLTFGDFNKFYLYSQSESRQGSISDQLVYLEPITKSDGSRQSAFIFDRLYGRRNSSILENQIETIIKKQAIVKKRFPESKISVFVSDAALSSSGTSSNGLLTKLQGQGLSATEESVEVDIIESAFADHYIEIGGMPREVGKRTVSGILISN